MYHNFFIIVKGGPAMKSLGTTNLADRLVISGNSRCNDIIPLSLHTKWSHREDGVALLHIHTELIPSLGFSTTHQVETEEVEDLPRIVLLQDLFEGVFDEPGQGLGRVLKGVAHEVVQRGALRGVAHQGPLLPLLRRGRQDAVSWEEREKMIHISKAKCRYMVSNDSEILDTFRLWSPNCHTLFP